MMLIDQNDPKFRKFVDMVTPPEKVHQVFLGEFLAVLELLWQIFKLLQGMGCFKKAAYARKVRAAMKHDRGQCEAMLSKTLYELRNEA